jgi:hypothetical protein
MKESDVGIMRQIKRVAKDDETIKKEVKKSNPTLVVVVVGLQGSQQRREGRKELRNFSFAPKNDSIRWSADDASKNSLFWHTSPTAHIGGIIEKTDLESNVTMLAPNTHFVSYPIVRDSQILAVDQQAMILKAVVRQSGEN